MPGTRDKSFKRLARLISSSSFPVNAGGEDFPRGLVFEGQNNDKPRTFARTRIEIEKVAERLADAFNKRSKK